MTTCYVPDIYQKTAGDSPAVWLFFLPFPYIAYRVEQPVDIDGGGFIVVCVCPDSQSPLHVRVLYLAGFPIDAFHLKVMQILIHRYVKQLGHDLDIQQFDIPVLYSVKRQDYQRRRF